MASFFAVVRHEERADVVDASLISGTHWCKTKDFAEWPLDPPLTDRGVKRSTALGQHIQQVAKECGAPVHIVISSPYHRCMQTAAAICEVLGPNTRLMVDVSLGEVYGPSVLGNHEPNSQLDRFRHHCSQSHIKTAGQWPKWPESLENARRRYARRFLKYLSRGTATQRNFVIVSHGDCVGAALSIMLSASDKIIDRIETGGMFFAQRQAPTYDKSHPCASSKMQEWVEFDAPDDSSPRNSMPDPLSALDLWKVQVHNIDVRMNKLKPSSHSTVKPCVEALLATLPQSPLAHQACCMQKQISNETSNSSSRLFAKSESSEPSGMSDKLPVSRSTAMSQPRQHGPRKVIRNVQRINALMETALNLKKSCDALQSDLVLDNEPKQMTSQFNLESSALMKRRLKGGTKLSL